jgi:hypothetical protein
MFRPFLDDFAIGDLSQPAHASCEKLRFTPRAHVEMICPSHAAQSIALSASLARSSAECEQTIGLTIST